MGYSSSPSAKALSAALARQAALEAELALMRRERDRALESLREQDADVKRLGTLAQHRLETIRKLEKRLAEYESVEPEPAERDSPDPNRYAVDPKLPGDDSPDSKPKPKPRCSRGGRKSLDEKIAKATAHEHVYPEGYSHEDCIHARTRVAWRYREGRAILIAYYCYRPRAGGPVAAIPGVSPQGEYGLEWALMLAFLMFATGLSMDRARASIRFFTKLSLKRSQADALLNRTCPFE